MNIRESAQDYLEAILILTKSNGSVKSVDVANYMNVTKQSVHRAIKNLKEEAFRCTIWCNEKLFILQHTGLCAIM